LSFDAVACVASSLQINPERIKSDSSDSISFDRNLKHLQLPICWGVCSSATVLLLREKLNEITSRPALLMYIIQHPLGLNDLPMAEQADLPNIPVDFTCVPSEAHYSPYALFQY
jgi:hypothetical protein